MSGGEASFGRQMKNGAEQAVADINAAGGVLGRKLKLEIGDDACDPKQARSVGEKFAGAKLPFVAGHYCSSSSIPASEAYAEGGVLQITPASTNPTFTERKLWNTFRVCGRDDQQGAVAGAYIARTFKGKNIAVVHDKTTYGKGLADETKKALNKAGIKEKLYESYNKGDKDFNALVSKLKLNAIDLVYVGGYHQESGLILRQMRDQGVKAVLMAGDALADKEFASITGAGGRRRAVHLRSRSAQQGDRQGDRRQVQGQEHRSGRLHALHLRRVPGLDAGGWRRPRPPTPRRSRACSSRAATTPCSASSRSTPRATSPSSTTSSTSGTARATTPSCRKASPARKPRRSAQTISPPLTGRAFCFSRSGPAPGTSPAARS